MATINKQTNTLKLIINNGILFIAFLYLYTALINFFSPISLPMSFVVISCTVITMVLLQNKFTFGIFAGFKINYKSFITVAVFILLLIWVSIVINRPTLDTDANVYHLPEAILMNSSLWYPGVARLAWHFGYPNGNSILASVFTAFNRIGFENIPNIIIWFIFGTGLFLYLKKKELTTGISLGLSALFLLMPEMFWQSYNMGTDLPCTCFIVFGLLSFYEKHFDDALFFLGLSAAFKTNGIVLFIMIMPYVFIKYTREKKFKELFCLKIILGTTIVLFSIIRISIATSNPAFPFFPYSLGDWGISLERQKDTIKALKLLIVSDRSLGGSFRFVRDFLFFPKKLQNSYWFSPFFLTISLTALVSFIKYKIYRHRNFHLTYLVLLFIIFFVVWYKGLPMFRFIAGVVMFLTIQAVIFTNKHKPGKIFNLLNHTALLFCLAFFIFNITKHIKKDVLPLINAGPEVIERFVPGDKSDISIRNIDGFTYYKANSSITGRCKVPCASSLSLGRGLYAGNDLYKEEDLIRDFRKYNKI